MPSPHGHHQPHNVSLGRPERLHFTLHPYSYLPVILVFLSTSARSIDLTNTHKLRAEYAGCSWAVGPSNGDRSSNESWSRGLPQVAYQQDLTHLRYRWPDVHRNLQMHRYCSSIYACLPVKPIDWSIDCPAISRTAMLSSLSRMSTDNHLSKSLPTLPPPLLQPVQAQPLLKLTWLRDIWASLWYPAST